MLLCLRKMDDQPRSYIFVLSSSAQYVVAVIALYSSHTLATGPTPSDHSPSRPIASGFPVRTLVRPVAPAYLKLTFPRPIVPKSPIYALARPVAPSASILAGSPAAPWGQTNKGMQYFVQAFYFLGSKTWFKAIALVCAAISLILLTMKLYLLLSSLLSRQLHLTQRDLSLDPSLDKTYLCRIFGVKFTDVIDFTGHINRTQFIAAGGSGEVWEASWIIPPKNQTTGPFPALPKVVVKLVRLPPLKVKSHKDKRYKRMKRELLLWSRLDHPHILPLIGVARIEGDANLPAFISPWMENGNVMDFLNENRSFPAATFLKHIIKGLHYLHAFKPVIVHGDIKGANVLINHRNEAVLSDFGLSHIVVDNTLWRTTATHANGTLRWMAPELIEGTMITPTVESDIYAFAMTCYEILSRKSPFSVTIDPAVILKVIEGKRPERIESCHNDEVWSIITQCWAQKPGDRPSTEKILELILQYDPSS